MTLLDQIKKELVNFHRLERTKEHLDQIKKDLARKRREHEDLVDRLSDQYASYEKLEGLSLKSLFHKVLGSKEKQMEKERQEYLQLSGELEGLTEAIKLLEFEEGVLGKKLDDYKNSKDRLVSLKQRREQKLLKGNSPASKRLRTIIDQIEGYYRLQSDIEEANSEGVKLAKMLRQMQSLLGRARQWGSYPQHPMRRHPHHYRGTMDQARKMSHQVQHQLTIFNRELQDVYPDMKPSDISFDFQRYDNFFLMFFDNLISDWIIQQRIMNTRHQVTSFLDRVLRSLQSLESEGQHVEASLAQLQDDRQRLLEGKTV